MILRQSLHTDPVIAASYLFGCGGHAAGAVVDPVGDVAHPRWRASAVGVYRLWRRSPAHLRLGSAGGRADARDAPLSLIRGARIHEDAPDRQRPATVGPDGFD
jgi:hydroxyacylglutathione hydrolase